MPMDRKRYPYHWERFSFGIKALANWQCQHCGRPCKRPDQDWGDFEIQVADTRWVEDLYIYLSDDEMGEVLAIKNRRFLLTVAHLDQNPRNNHPSNLKALCSVCHLNHDRPFRKANRKRKLERLGQLALRI